MGSLAFAAGGAAAGLGQGMAQVGQTLMKEQVERGLMDLRNQYEDQRQANQQAFQSGEAEKTRTFESGLKHEEMTAGAALKHEEMAQTERLHQETEAGANQRNLNSTNARIDAAVGGAFMRGGQGGSKAAAAIKPWQVQKLKVAPRDKQGNLVPGTQAEDVQTYFDPNLGSSWVRTPEGYVRSDSKGNPITPPSARNRVPATDEEIQHVMRSPYEVIPDQIDTPRAFKGGGTMKPANAGLTYLQAFEKEHGVVPVEVMENVRKLAQQQQIELSGQSGGSFTLPMSGKTIERPAGFTGGGAAEAPEPPGDQSDND